MSSFLKRDFSSMLAKMPKRPAKAPAHAVDAGGKRHKQVVGLKIGASQIAAAVVSNNGSPSLVAAVREDLPEGIVSGGEPRDAVALAAAVSAFFQKNDLPRRNVRLGIGSNRVGVRVFERPAVEGEAQLANAIRFRAHETLPIPIEEAMLDYHVFDDGNGGGRVLLAVAYRELVDRLAGACAQAKLDLVGVDVEAFALLRALTDRPLAGRERDEFAHVVVAIGHDRTTVAVSDGRVCEFTRTLEWGGAKLNAAIERTLSVTPEEAERIKRSVDLGAAATDDAGEDADRKAADAVRRELQPMARELASSLHFYQGQPDSLSFKELVVTGGTSHLHGIAEHLRELIGVDVRVGDPFARVGGGGGVAAGDQPGSLAVAIGLGIED